MDGIFNIYKVGDTEAFAFRINFITLAETNVGALHLTGPHPNILYTHSITNMSSYFSYDEHEDADFWEWAQRYYYYCEFYNKLSEKTLKQLKYFKSAVLIAKDVEFTWDEEIDLI